MSLVDFYTTNDAILAKKVVLDSGEFLLENALALARKKKLDLIQEKYDIDKYIAYCIIESVNKYEYKKKKGKK